MTTSESVSPFVQHKDVAALTPKERRKLIIWRIVGIVLPLVVIALAVGAIMVMGAMKPEPEKKEDVVKAMPVLTARALQEDVTLKVSVQGEVQPRTQINLVPQVSGKINYMSPKFIEGGKFRKGELLVRVEPREYELRVIQARANVAQAETVIAREQSESDNARRDWEELGRGSSPTALTLREPQLAEARAQLEAAKAQLGEAELNLSRASLYAPFSGRVMQRAIDKGEFVVAGTQLGEIYATDIMDVRFPLTNDELRRIGLTLGFETNKTTPAIPVTLQATIAGTDNVWQGQIVRTDSMFDTSTRVLYAYAEVKGNKSAGPDNTTPLAPGIFVNAEIEGEALTDVTVIPRGALRGTDKVYLANSDDTLSIQTVSVLSSDRNRAILSSGVSSGQAVITSPIRGVADGMKVQIVTSEAMLSEAVSPEAASEEGAE